MLLCRNLKNRLEILSSQAFTRLSSLRTPNKLAGMTLGRTQILIADDHETTRLQLAALLSHRLDWEVCGLAADGQEAVDIAKKFFPDLAVLDVQMPRLNGIEAARAILRYCPHAIIVSGHEVNLFAGQRGALAGRNKHVPIFKWNWVGSLGDG
jgi:CheY-like chemotaxis protein